MFCIIALITVVSFVGYYCLVKVSKPVQFLNPTFHTPPGCDRAWFVSIPREKATGDFFAKICSFEGVFITGTEMEGNKLYVMLVGPKSALEAMARDKSPILNK